MKKIFSLILLFLCVFSFVSCGEKAENQNKTEAFTPLFRFTVGEGTSQETRLFYLPQSDGFLYLHKGENGGFTGGFVSPSRSLSSEGLVKSDGDLNSVTIWEKGKDCAYLLTEKELILTLLKENNSHSTPLPENIATEGALPFDSLSFLSKKENLVLLHPVDFAETYVLCDSSGLPDFDSLLTVNDDGKKIWYTKKNQSGAFTGIGFFEYGKNVPLGNRDFAFDSYEKLSSDAFLFVSLGEDSATYRYLNLTSGEEKIYTAKTPFDVVSCDKNGTTLCGGKNKGDGSEIAVIDLDSGKEKGVHTIEYGNLSNSLALNFDGTTLLLAFGKGKDQVIATLDLTKF